MIKHNKFILAILAFAVSASVLAYKTTIRVSAETLQLGAYNREEDKELPTYEAVDKNGITWEYKELSDGTLYLVYAKNVQAHMEVPSQLNGKNVSVIGDIVQYRDWRDYLKLKDVMDYVIQSVKIPSTVKFIGPSSFQCANLTDVQLPTTTWISDSAFEYTPWYEKQRDSEGLIIINHKLFDAKNQFGDIKIPSKVKEIAGNAFKDQEVTSIIIPNSVTEIDEYAFRRCEKLKSVVIPSSVTEIKEDTFISCDKLEKVTIPNSVNKIGENAFYNCSSLKKIIIPNSVTYIGKSAFSECSSLESIEIPDSVKEIDNDAFFECSSLKKIKLPDNVKLGTGVFDDDVIIIKDGISHVYKDLNNTSANKAKNKSISKAPVSIIGNTNHADKVPQGWHKDGEHWYCSWSDGSKRNGWYDENGKRYYFYGNGQMATELIDLNGYSYYLQPNSVDGKAEMVTGWKYINGNWFYFNPDPSGGLYGLMKRACWAYIDGRWYYFYYNGTMAHSTYIDGYYVNSSGAWVN